jgi:Fe-Mn family superoxide dismutase
MTTEEKVQLPTLPYEYNALEPTISAEIMQLHYLKHHQAYVTNFNKALDQYAQAEMRGDYAQMIALQSALRFNGGGHINHSIFWTNLAPVSEGGGTPPQGPLADALKQQFSSLQRLIDEFSNKAIAVQGSGWCWLGYDKAAKTFHIVTTSNQDPLSTLNLVPLLGVDVWEHAYYLQYKNVRADYVKAIWNVINWQNVAERYEKALAS